MKKIFILLMLFIPFTYETNEYEKSKEKFLKRNAPVYDECFGLISFCYKGYMRCEIDCNLMAEDSCLPYKMPVKLHHNRLIKCKG